MTKIMNMADKTLDLRDVPITERKARMETALPLIEAGDEMIVVLDQDPAPLFQEIDRSKLVRSLEVKELEAGPTLWRLLVQAPEEGSGHGCGCCGSCGG